MHRDVQIGCFSTAARFSDKKYPYSIISVYNDPWSSDVKQSNVETWKERLVQLES